MAISKVQICNLALSRVGANSISSLTDASNESRACNLLFDHVRDAILADFPWNSCMRRVQLSMLADAPAWGYDHKYQLPVDCLRVWEVSADGDVDTSDAVEFLIEGRELLTDEDTIYIRYTMNESDPSIYSKGLVQTIVARLAFELSSTLVRLTSDIRAQLLAEYERTLNAAQAVDGFEGTTVQRGTHDFINVRY